MTDINHGFVYLQPIANTPEAQELLEKTFADNSITIDSTGEVSCSTLVRENDLLFSPIAPFLHFGKSIRYFCVSWSEERLTWDRFVNNIIGGEADPEENAASTLRFKLFDQHEELGMEGATDEAEQGIYASRSAIQAISDRIVFLTPFEKTKDSEFNLMAAIQEDVFGKVLAEQGGINALSLLERYVRDVYHARSKSNLFAMVDLMGSDECLTIVESEGETFVDCVSPGKGLGARRSTMRVTGEAPESEDVYVDNEFRGAHRDIEEWRRIGEIFPESEDGGLLPNDPLIEQFSQGTNGDCSILAAFALLCHLPKVLENIFVSKEVRTDGMYTFQFYRGDKWEKVEIDDSLPMWRGQVAYCTSPTKHWWPCLLEKAYAKLYGSYNAISGSSMSEIIHDLTSKPVLSFVLKQEFVDQGVIPDYKQASWWMSQGERMRSDSIVLAVPASRSDGQDGLPSRTDAEDIGLEPGHGYGVLDIVSTKEDDEELDSLDEVLLKVHNPFKAIRYNGPYSSASDFTPELLERLDLPPTYQLSENDRVFYIPVGTILEASRTLCEGQIDAVEPHPYVLSGNWTFETAGGPPTCASWRTNPMYTVCNKSPNPISCMVMLKQPDQRVNPIEGSISGGGDFTYKQCGITVVQSSDSSVESYETTYLTNNIFKPIHRGVFLNQRDVTDSVTFPANSTSYIVPSTFEAGELSKFLLAVYIPDGTSHKDFVVRRPELEVDTVFPNHIELSLEPKKKVYTDIVVRKATQLHCLLVQHKDKSKVDPTAPDLTCETYVAMMVYDENDAKIASMSSGVNYKETGLLLELPAAGRYHVMATCLKGVETSDCSLFLSTSPEAEAVLGPYRKLAEEEDAFEDWKEGEEERIAEQAAADEVIRAKKAKADADAKKKQDEEAERERLAEEAERKKQEKADAEAKRKEEEEAERIRKEEESERKRQEKKEADAKKKEEEEAERKRKEEEYERKKAEKQAADALRKEEEDAERTRKEEEAVRKRKEKQEADAEKKEAEEAERKRKEAERLEAKRLAEEEAARVQKEKDEEMDRKRKAKADADAEKKEAEEAERAQKAEEAERKKQEKADAEAKRKEEEEANRAAEEEKRRLKKEEADAKKAEDEAAKKAELEERAEKRRLEKEEKERQRQEAAKTQSPRHAKPPGTSPPSKSNKQSPRTRSTSATRSSSASKGHRTRKSSGKEHYFQPTAASRGHRTQHSEQAPALPSIHKNGFGSSSPRNLGTYQILPYIRKYEENIF